MPCGVDKRKTKYIKKKKKKKKRGSSIQERRRLFPHGGSAWIVDKPSKGAEGELSFFQIGPLSLLSSRTL